jgi:hypothetical protein
MVKAEKCNTVVRSVLDDHKGIDYFINSNGDCTSTYKDEIRRSVITVLW